MTPLAFEQRYRHEWQELAELLARIPQRRIWRRQPPDAVNPERLAALYRRVCEQLAAARARAYPAHIVERLEHLAQEAHQAIYRVQDFGLRRFISLMNHDVPRAVRDHAAYVWLAAAIILLPAIAMGVLVHQSPELILSVMSADQASELEQMYARTTESIGRTRDADTDWRMFGYYIQHNTSLGFQCYAGGFFAGLLSIFALGYNGVFLGALAGYLTERGLGDMFWSFVATHAAFELTAIVLAGAAGIRLGHALLVPGCRTRLQSLVHAARRTVTVVYGFAVLFLIAAAVEAFWSSAPWVPHVVKYLVAAVCWSAVLMWLWRGGRRNARG
jgi:uncharacterized membrane protein SpoIIM required for sporulation